MRVFKNGAPAGTAADIDLREGAGISLTVSDESGANGATGITIAASGPMAARYLIVPVVGGGVKAINCATLATDYSTTSTTDHSGVWQSAINALALQNGGQGGAILFKGQHIWANPVTLYTGIGIIGEGPNGNKQVQDTGSTIKSTYNGATLVITGVNSSNQYFPFLSNFSMWGLDANTSQDLVRVDNSGGAVPFDTFLDHVTFFDAGRNILYLDATAVNAKVWCDGCYFESAQNDGIQINAGHLAVTNSYIFGSTRYGIFCDNTGSDVFVQNNRLWSNAGGGIFTVHTSELIVTGNSFDTNGTNNSANPQVMAKNTPYLVLNDNVFNDARGASACNYHVRLAQGGAIGLGSVVGNVFGPGGQLQKIYKDYVLADKVAITDNSGYNDSFGKIASPFNTAHIGMEGGGVGVPTASTDYRVVGTPLYAVFSGGTSVSITLKDAAGNTVQSGLTSYAGPLPIGFTVNFGAFTVAPTVYVGVV